ncbi:ABC transporter related [Candidatus Vecturithrix granuli]|uniref:ABC transporter related n=1 Tax=Vecturithrix granuli TaxID=1499967 RepID=A0A081C3B3_VECG1|nr:ABC transporter related [Candidatus Vecturithrix granuli]
MLELRGITKDFPGVRALDNVSVQFHAGEIHALLGENGAGKSTLIKIISGIYQPDAGEITYNGEQLHFHNFRDGLQAGISIVNQEIQVIPESSIAENIMLDKMITYGKTGVVNWKRINEVAQTYLEMVGLDLPPATVTRDLSVAHKQLVQIAKALASNAKILLLDEPTSSITEHEVDTLFHLLRNLKTKGVVVIFVTHKLEEVFALCDKITVLRDGQCVGTVQSTDIDTHALVAMMIGRETDDKSYGVLDVDAQNIVLEAKHLYKKEKAHDVSFQLYKGEILGFYGLVGAGRTETARLLIGEDTLAGGEITIQGARAHIKSVADSLYRYNMGYITENRKEEGLLLEAPVKTNIAITIWNKIVHPLFQAISPAKETQFAQNMVDALAIKVIGVNQITETLSGGNQQKVSISKWLAAGCDILIMDEPTVGVDVGAKEYIHKLIWDLASQDKKSIILISSDMPEIIKLASRILVFKDKHIVGEVTGINTPTRDYNRISRQIGHYLA